MRNELRHKLIRSIFISLVFLLFVYMFWPFFTAILLATLFAFALHDSVTSLTHGKLSRSNASLVLILGILVFIATPLVFVVLKTISTIKDYSAMGLQNTSLYQSTEKLLHTLTVYTTEVASRFDLDLSKLPKPVELLSRYSDEIGGFITRSVAELPSVALSFIVFFLALYYFLNESKKVKSLFFKFDLLSESEINKIIRIIKRSSYLTLVASVLIGLLQAFIITLFAYFCGFTDFIVVFIITFISSLIPVVGSGPVTLFLMLIAFIQGDTGAGIAMIVAFAIASSVDNLIKPLILNTASEDLHPIVSLLALVGAILVYGPPGLLLGPILTQLAFNILPILNSVENSGEITTTNM
jgi:predicted PurR-regulated permease PerM